MAYIGYDVERKIIDQRIYDDAMAHGFPPAFFRQSFFDHVTLYCVPDQQDCSLSVFQDCKFSVCRLCGVSFEKASIYSSEFNTAEIADTLFHSATIAHTHFRDCRIIKASFQEARIQSSRMLDCVMEQIDYTDATLDGCAFDRVKADGIIGLHTATITQGGATTEEVKRNREAVFRALAPPKQSQRKKPQKVGHKR